MTSLRRTFALYSQTRSDESSQNWNLQEEPEKLLYLLRLCAWNLGSLAAFTAESAARMDHASTSLTRH